MTGYHPSHTPRLALGNGSNGAVKAEDDLARRVLDTLRDLDTLRALARTYPDDAAVRERLASGLRNTLNAVKAEDDLARPNALLDELRDLALGLGVKGPVAPYFP
jgi:hypothetical protein